MYDGSDAGVIDVTMSGMDLKCSLRFCLTQLPLLPVRAGLSQECRGSTRCLLLTTAHSSAFPQRSSFVPVVTSHPTVRWCIRNTGITAATADDPVTRAGSGYTADEAACRTSLTRGTLQRWAPCE